MDVKTTFLNRNLTEDMYMIHPEGFVDPSNADKVCKLQKSIYGLKQSYIHFDEVVESFGFIKSDHDSCLYKKFSGSKVNFLILYVDDILLIGNDVQMLQETKESLERSFSMKDLVEATYILGI